MVSKGVAFEQVTEDISFKRRIGVGGICGRSFRFWQRGIQIEI